VYEGRAAAPSGHFTGADLGQTAMHGGGASQRKMEQRRQGPYPMVLGSRYGSLRTVGGILVLYLDVTGGGPLQPPSIQVEALGSFRGLERCSLSRWRGSSGFESPRQRRRLAIESVAWCGVPRGHRGYSLYRGKLCCHAQGLFN
jgi:hypothetical protein